MHKRFFTILLIFGLALGTPAQDPAFTYQGALALGGDPVTGAHDFRFNLHDDPVAGNVVGGTNFMEAIEVVGGLFTATLDFGGAPFDGRPLWLEIAVRPGGSEVEYQLLAPRQPLTAAPYAFSAAGLAAPAGGPLDIRAGGQRVLRLEPAAIAPNFVAGSDLNSVAAGVHGGAVAGGWSNRVAQAGATIAGGVQNTNAGLQAAIGGGARNTITGEAEGAVIAGGFGNTVDDRAATVGGGSVNLAAGQLSTIAGGYKNYVGGSYSFVGGGGLNVATGQGAFVGGGGNTEFFVERGTNHLASGDFSAVVAGRANTASGRHAFVGGGRLNVAAGEGAFVGGGQESAGGGYLTNNLALGANSVVTGGRLNTAVGVLSSIPGGEGNQTPGPYAVAAGGNNRAGGPYALALGFSNVADGHSTVALGYDNSATANFGVALGAQARSVHQGALVWADSGPAELYSVADDSVTLRAGGGVRIFSDASSLVGVSLLPGENAWGVLSDRERKKDVRPLDGREVLDKLAAIPISTWHYDFEPAEATPHIGPMAQDFKAAFYPGRDDRRITTHEVDGVALAAIQGLNEKLEERGRTLERRLEQKETEIAELQRQNADLLRRLAVIEQRLK